MCYSTAHEHSQPDCNLGWDSHLECYFFGYHLYMYVASDSHSDLPVFPLLERASRHDMLSFLHSFFSMKAYLPEFRIENSFWIPPMTLMLSMSTADRKISLPLSTLIPDIPDISLIRTISPLMRTASRSVRWAYVCIKTDMRLLSTGRNTVVQNQIGHVAASVSIPVHLQNTEEPYTFLQQIIQDYLTYRQETVKHGKRNMMEVLP